MSSSCDTPSNKIKWWKSMKAKMNHAEQQEFLRQKEADKADGGPKKKNKKSLTAE